MYRTRRSAAMHRLSTFIARQITVHDDRVLAGDIRSRRVTVWYGACTAEDRHPCDWMSSSSDVSQHDQAR
jgi:hypothetical protein